MALNFPNSPSNGDIFNAPNGVVYIFDGISSVWIVQPPAPTNVADGSITPEKLSTGGPVWNANGRLGVNTASPTTQVHITGVSGEDPTIRVVDADSSAYADIEVDEGSLHLHADRGNSVVDSNITLNIDGTEVVELNNTVNYFSQDLITGDKSLAGDHGVFRSNEIALMTDASTSVVRFSSDGSGTLAGPVTAKRLNVAGGEGGSPETAIAIYSDTASTTETATLRDDGSAEFSSTIASTTNSAGGEYNFLIKDPNGADNAGGLFTYTGGRSVLALAGSYGDYKSVVLDGETGLSTFGVQPNGQTFNIRPLQTGNANSIWLKDSDNDIPFYVTAEGSGYYERHLHIGSSGGRTSIIVNSADTNAQRGTIQLTSGSAVSGDAEAFSIQKSGNTRFRIEYSGEVSSAAITAGNRPGAVADSSYKVFSGRTASDSETSFIAADGSATFEGNVQINGTIASPLNIYGQTLIGSNTGSDFVIRGYSETLSSYTSGITADGNATFDGFVRAGGDPDNGGSTGVSIESGGIILVTRSAGNTVFAGHKQGTSAATSVIDSDGNLTLSGDISVSSGNISVSSGDISVSSGDISVSSGDILVGSNLTIRNDGAIYSSAGGFSLSADGSAYLSAGNLSVNSVGLLTTNNAVVSGGTPWTGSSGASLSAQGVVSATQSSGSNIFEGRISGSTTVTSNISAQGSAYFASDVYGLSFETNPNGGGVRSYRSAGGSAQCWRSGTASNALTASIYADGSAHFATNDFYVDNGGSVWLHTSGNANSGNFRIGLNSNGNATFTGDVTVQNLNSTSDLNLKENISTISDHKEILDTIKGVRFDWKESGNASAGVVAQDVEKVLPELVSTVTKGNGEDFKAVNYNGLVGVLIEAVKDLSAKVEELEAKLDK